MAKAVFIPTNRDEAIIKKLRMYFGDSANIQPSYIRLEKVLTATNVAETFTLGNGASSGNKRPLEQYLSQNDIFVCSKMGVFVQKVVTNLDGNNGNSVNYPYPDKSVFNDPTVGTSQAEIDALEAVYNGIISMKSDTYEVIDNLSLQEFRTPPQTQNAATTQASLGLVNEGFVPLHLVPVFEGKKRNELRFQPAQGADVALIGGKINTQNVLVFQMMGYVVRTASEPITYAEAVKNGVLQ